MAEKREEKGEKRGIGGEWMDSLVNKDEKDEKGERRGTGQQGQRRGKGKRGNT